MLRAILIVVGVGILVAMELGTPPRTARAVNEPLVAQSTVGIGDSRDTLTKADRLEISYVRNEEPAQPISFVERMPPANSTPIISREAPKIINRRWHDPNAKKVAVAPPKPRPKNPDSKRVTNTDRSKAVVDVNKPCRPNAFDSFLKALNLSPDCET
jgi:hypothetical protein